MNPSCFQGDPTSSITAGQGIPGGCSWTTNWLKFDNSYFRRHGAAVTAAASSDDANPNPNTHNDNSNDELLWLPTDQALAECPEWRPYFMHYASNDVAFRDAYASAHVRMSQLGARFRPSQGITLS